MCASTTQYLVSTCILHGNKKSVTILTLLKNVTLTDYIKVVKTKVGTD